MLRPTTLYWAAPPIRQLLASSLSPFSFTPAAMTINQQIIRTKATINKHRLPKKKFQDLESTRARYPPKPITPVEPTGPRPPPPFIINRTPSNNLPVYFLTKRGGNKKLTLIRKLEGDRVALAQWLAEDLGLERKQVRVKSPTNHVELDVSFPITNKPLLSSSPILSNTHPI